MGRLLFLEVVGGLRVGAVLVARFSGLVSGVWHVRVVTQHQVGVRAAPVLQEHDYRQLTMLCEKDEWLWPAGLSLVTRNSYKSHSLRCSSAYCRHINKV